MEKIGLLLGATYLTTDTQTAALVASCCAMTNTLYFKHCRRPRNPGTKRSTKVAVASVVEVESKLPATLVIAERSSDLQRSVVTTVKQQLTTLFCLLYACCICIAQEPPSVKKTELDPQVQSLLDEIKKENDRPSWPIDRLTRDSDAILACKMISQLKVGYDASIAGDYAGLGLDCYVTKMAVLATLKGNAPTEIEVVTIKYSSDVGFVGRKHNFAKFDTKLKLPVLIEFVIDDKITGYGANDPVETTTIEPEYLLFLRERRDKRYEPITGQRYSALSVKVLND